jgi:hypothetical protein
MEKILGIEQGEDLGGLDDDDISELAQSFLF